jgi:hypothetical protein
VGGRKRCTRARLVGGVCQCQFSIEMSRKQQRESQIAIVVFRAQIQGQGLLESDLAPKIIRFLRISRKDASTRTVPYAKATNQPNQAQSKAPQPNSLASAGRSYSIHQYSIIDDRPRLLAAGRSSMQFGLRDCHHHGQLRVIALSNDPASQYSLHSATL